MNSSFAEKTLQEIERQMGEIKAFDLDEKQKSYFARYLVVFICGSFESIVESILCEYADKLRNSQISNFVAKSLHLNFRNPDYDKIVDFLNRFDEDWSKQMNNLAKANSNAITSIIVHKNELAHTGNSTITLSQIEDLYDRAKVVIKKIDQVVLS